MLCQGKMKFRLNVREMSGKFKISSLYQIMISKNKWLRQFYKHFGYKLNHYDKASKLHLT